MTKVVNIIATVMVAPGIIPAGIIWWLYCNIRYRWRGKYPPYHGAGGIYLFILLAAICCIPVYILIGWSILHIATNYRIVHV